jgi:hypothetical protein
MASNNTTEQERAQLYKTIWQIANDLRGSVDGWDFKQYVLGMLFYASSAKTLPITSTSRKEKLTPTSITPNFRMNKLNWDGPIR